jgi:hypothetical protein
MKGNKIPKSTSVEEHEKSVNKNFSNNSKLSKIANELLLKLGRNPNDYEPADYI